LQKVFWPQEFPQLPQLFALVFRLISQPFEGFKSQLAESAEQDMQAPVEQYFEVPHGVVAEDVQVQSAQLPRALHVLLHDGGYVYGVLPTQKFARQFVVPQFAPVCIVLPQALPEQKGVPQAPNVSGHSVQEAGCVHCPAELQDRDVHN
jgi:hypothetical protein